MKDGVKDGVSDILNFIVEFGGYMLFLQSFI